MGSFLTYEIWITCCDSMELEYVTVSEVFKEAVRLRKFLGELEIWDQSM